MTPQISPCAFGDCVDVEEYKILEYETNALSKENEFLRSKIQHQTDWIVSPDELLAERRVCEKLLLQDQARGYPTGSEWQALVSLAKELKTV